MISLFSKVNKRPDEEASAPAAPEYPAPEEGAFVSDEFPQPRAEREFNETPGPEEALPCVTKKQFSYARFMELAAVLLAAVVTTSAIGRDILKEDPLAQPRYTISDETAVPETAEITEPDAGDPSDAPAQPSVPETSSAESTAVSAETTAEAAETTADILETTSDITESVPPETETEEETTPAEEIYDDAFPELVNLWPNGYSSPNWTNTYEYINDYLAVPADDSHNYYLEPGAEYLIVGSSTVGTLPIHVGVNRTGEFDPIVDLSAKGLSYDPDTNTVTLTDFQKEDGDIGLEANLMGNNFTIVVNGECRLSWIKIWGWYFGGSLTITGDGTLTVNGEKTRGVGIYLYSEYSPSALMIDRNVTVDVYANPEITNSAAVYVYATTDPAGIYWLRPQEMSGGTVKQLQKADLSMGTVYVFGIMNEEDTYSTHVTFSPYGELTAED